MYESRATHPLSQRAYVKRLLVHAAAAAAIVFGSLLAGMCGYHWLEGLDWLDAFINAAMLLGGEGPLEQPQSRGGKLFAGMYAIYSGVLFIGIAGLLLAPVVHRLLHRFHWEDDLRD
jgi:hypothetical protein